MGLRPSLFFLCTLFVLQSNGALEAQNAISLEAPLQPPSLSLLQLSSTTRDPFLVNLHQLLRASVLSHHSSVVVLKLLVAARLRNSSTKISDVERSARIYVSSLADDYQALLRDFRESVRATLIKILDATEKIVGKSSKDPLEQAAAKVETDIHSFQAVLDQGFEQFDTFIDTLWLKSSDRAESSAEQAARAFLSELAEVGDPLNWTPEAREQFYRLLKISTLSEFNAGDASALFLKEILTTFLFPLAYGLALSSSHDVAGTYSQVPTAFHWQEDHTRRVEYDRYYDTCRLLNNWFNHQIRLGEKLLEIKTVFLGVVEVKGVSDIELSNHRTAVTSLFSTLVDKFQAVLAKLDQVWSQNHCNFFNRPQKDTPDPLYRRIVVTDSDDVNHLVENERPSAVAFHRWFAAAPSSGQKNKKGAERWRLRFDARTGSQMRMWVCAYADCADYYLDRPPGQPTQWVRWNAPNVRNTYIRTHPAYQPVRSIKNFVFWERSPLGWDKQDQETPHTVEWVRGFEVDQVAPARIDNEKVYEFLPDQSHKRVVVSGLRKEIFLGLDRTAGAPIVHVSLGGNLYWKLSPYAQSWRTRLDTARPLVPLFRSTADLSVQSQTCYLWYTKASQIVDSNDPYSPYHPRFEVVLNKLFDQEKLLHLIKGDSLRQVFAMPFGVRQPTWAKQVWKLPDYDPKKYNNYIGSVTITSERLSEKLLSTWGSILEK
eukprot:gnl/Spiro4/1585_TR839_c0_g1_i2.p1 gnl/Spiro4/1585_TR839_c0_g1~~gnl/Spiro4/1585_TR839_c0_g1_i2.p1  ORF type:complete len:721 (-),score=100.22 gnl/Spiro4/1585_TR839_c0_g1_i2:17-2155(-)